MCYMTMLCGACYWYYVFCTLYIDISCAIYITCVLCGSLNATWLCCIHYVLYCAECIVCVGVLCVTGTACIVCGKLNVFCVTWEFYVNFVLMMCCAYIIWGACAVCPLNVGHVFQVCWIYCIYGVHIAICHLLCILRISVMCS